MLWTDRLESGSSLSLSYHLPSSSFNPRISGIFLIVAVFSAYQAGLRKTRLDVCIFVLISKFWLFVHWRKHKSIQKQTMWTVNQSISPKLTFLTAPSCSFVHSNHLQFFQRGRQAAFSYLVSYKVSTQWTSIQSCKSLSKFINFCFNCLVHICQSFEKCNKVLQQNKQYSAFFNACN